MQLNPLCPDKRCLFIAGWVFVDKLRFLCASQSVLCASQSVLCASQSVLCASQSVLCASQSVLCASQSVLCASQSVLCASQSKKISASFDTKGLPKPIKFLLSFY